jgi:large subunit ribosomal protein L16
MLFPKKVKYRKWHTFRKNPSKVGPDSRGLEISFGSFGLKAMTAGRIRSNQIEAARKAVVKSVGKNGKVWIRIFPDMPYTLKPAEVKMGKGKGDVQGYVAPVRAGRVLFEVDGVGKDLAKEALRKAGAKLPLKTRVIARE